MLQEHETTFIIMLIPLHNRLVQFTYSVVDPFCNIRAKAQVFLEQFRQCLHGTGSVWNRWEIGTDKSCVYTGPGGSGTNRICYLIPNGSTYEGDPIENRTVPVLNRSRVNRVDPNYCGSDPKRILTYPIPCKRSLSIV